MNTLYAILIVFVFKVDLITSQTCQNFKTCGECIGNSLHCAWCPDKDHKEPRCMPNQNLKLPGKKWCQAPVNPQTLAPQVEPITEAVQFKPQVINIKIRPGDTVQFKMSYKPELDYPIDIYYLMDNSATMNFHKQALVDQAHVIRDRLKILSNNVRFGVGTFVEKLALPYADQNIHMLDTFTNRLSLTKDIDKLVEVVKAVKHTGNFDIPEAAFDGLMQVMTCKDEIHWRDDARRMIILSTDAPYHSAGDGKMVGAYKPNDMQCHLTNNSYGADASLLYDYPSVSQINKVATEKDFSIIFAVLKQVEEEYKTLAGHINTATYVELKNDNSLNTNSGLAALIENEYLKLANHLEIDRGFVPSHFDLKISPPCDKNEKCEVGNKKSIELNASLRVTSCPANKKFKETLKIGPYSLSEKLVVNVEVLCECDCEKTGQEFKSISCSGSTYQCGVCKCNSNTYGKTCDCKGDSTEELDQLKCKTNVNSTAVCSGRGDCKCGECECWDEDTFEGPLCQYKKNDCPVSDNRVCGGNGLCKNNKCHCKPGWSGTACACSLKIEECIGGNGEVCTGNGNCICGKCECSSRRYSGEYCESCDTCIEDRCKQLGAYVECLFNKEAKSACDKRFDVINERTVHLLNRTEIKHSDWRHADWCKRTLADQSSILFKYKDGRNSTLILIQKDKELPPEANIWIPIGSAIGTILLVGILSVVAWKLLVDIHDEREYKKFLKESEDAGYNVSVNPLYSPPATNITNPAFNPRDE